MSVTDEYCAMAEECFRRAGEAESDNERPGYLELALTWLEAASKVIAVFPFIARLSCSWRH
jgi:hypothetical protein